MGEKFIEAWNKMLDRIVEWFNLFIENLPNIILAIVVFVLFYWISRMISRYFNKFLGRFVEQLSVRRLIANSISVVFIGLGLIISLSVLNLDNAMQSLLAGAGIAGLAVGLALQGVLSNTFSGIFLAVKDSINIGDWIETNGFAGKVIDINLRNTKLLASDNNIVIIPNKSVIENSFKNFSLTKQIRTTINCSVSYDTDLEKAKVVAIASIESLYPPIVGKEVEFYYRNFSQSSIDFILRFWVDGTDGISSLEVRSEAISAIKTAFDKNGIEIPIPVSKVIRE